MSYAHVERLAQLEAQLATARAALIDALEGLDEMYGYVPPYFAEKWRHAGYAVRARAALETLGTASNTRSTAGRLGGGPGERVNAPRPRPSPYDEGA